MKRLRLIGGLLCVVVVGAAFPARAADAPSLPFDSTWTDENCDKASRTVDPGLCRVDGRASASNGAAAAEAALVSPGGGTIAWSADSSSAGYVVATYRVTQPVRRLDFVVEMRVTRAHIALSTNPAGERAGWYLDPLLDRHAYVGVAAHTVHSACSQCGYGEGATVLSSWTPGTTADTTGEGVILNVHVSRDDGGDVPPGVVTVRAGTHAGVSHMQSWGDDVAEIDAVVTRISLS